MAFAASVARGRTIDYSTLLGQLDQHVGGVLAAPVGLVQQPLWTADLFEGLGAKLGIIQSMGRVESALDKRGVQEFLLDAGVRAAEEEALRHQGRGPPRSSPATSTATTGCGVTAPVR